VTGTCLFGQSSAVAFLADGSRHSIVSSRRHWPSPIERLAIRDAVSLYEVDTAYRLSSVIRSMAEGRGHRVHVYIHIPVPEYVLFMLGRQRGRAHGAVMREWLAAVDRRGAEVGRLFQGVLKPEETQLQVAVGSPLDDVLMPVLREAIAAGNAPTVREIMGLIRGYGSPISEALDHWLATRAGTKIGYDELAQFGYVAGILTQMHGDGDLTIEVENPAEEPIFRAAARVVRRARERDLDAWNGNLMAVYPHEQTVELREGALDWCADGVSSLSGDMVKRVMRQYDRS
jgi:hypothetical protein